MNADTGHKKICRQGLMEALYSKNKAKKILVMNTTARRYREHMHAYSLDFKGSWWCKIRLDNWSFRWIYWFARQSHEVSVNRVTFEHNPSHSDADCPDSLLHSCFHLLLAEAARLPRCYSLCPVCKGNWTVMIGPRWQPSLEVSQDIASFSPLLVH